MNGPLVAKLKSLRELGNEPQPLDEMVVIMEIDMASGMVLLQRDDNRLYLYPLNELILETELRVTRLSPLGPRMVS